MACKRSLDGVEVVISAKLPDISCPQFHLPLLGSLAWWHAWWRPVAKVGTSNQDRTISLKAAVRSCTNNTLHAGQDLVQHVQYSTLLKAWQFREEIFSFLYWSRLGLGPTQPPQVSFPRVNRPGYDVDHPPPSSPDVKERLELYLHIPSVSSWHATG